MSGLWSVAVPSRRVVRLWAHSTRYLSFGMAGVISGREQDPRLLTVYNLPAPALSCVRPDSAWTIVRSMQWVL